MRRRYGGKEEGGVRETNKQRNKQTITVSVFKGREWGKIYDWVCVKKEKWRGTGRDEGSDIKRGSRGNSLTVVEVVLAWGITVVTMSVVAEAIASTAFILGGNFYLWQIRCSTLGQLAFDGGFFWLRFHAWMRHKSNQQIPRSLRSERIERKKGWRRGKRKPGVNFGAVRWSFPLWRCGTRAGE